MVHEFAHATSAEEQESLIHQLNQIRSDVSSMYTIAHIRNTINTQDEFYKTEHQFFDQNLPRMEALENEFYHALVGSTYRVELEKQFGTQLFQIAELAIHIFAPDIVEDLQETNQLSTEYNNLLASAQIDF
ncbi:gluzincin family metallopeptidase [Alicyclobacillus dauci]|uniref:Uncharacterized protein n=1 Tax=Alicyclobacillus dauci TaxID=1475485 RepID=A0ABY6YXT1_9BACL|nr:hypothetical protein [Alicyclobacillus dauci]WAH35419.1 hypothetical protein NZD86_14050 [Alicyclobacillus dauci]